MSEYSEGDRIRTLVEASGIPAGTKGNVIYSDNTGTVITAKIDGLPCKATFRNNQLEIVASTGEWERTRALQGINYAGLNLPEELMEAQAHIRTLIEADYNYPFIEKYMFGMGYGYDIIRKAFKVVSGMRPDEAMHMCAIDEVPGCIPQFNYAWGEAKKGDKYYFIMSIANKYTLFCQHDDRNRTDEDTFSDLMSAKEALKKHVKKVMEWAPPVKDSKPKEKKEDMTQLYRQPQMFMQAAKIREWEDSMSRYASNHERIALITQACEEGMLDEAVATVLLKKYGMDVKADAEEDMEETAVKEKLDEMEKDKLDKPIRDEIAEKTPSQFFQRNKLQKNYDNLPADTIDAVSRYIFQANADLREFELKVYSFKFTSVEPAKKKSPAGSTPDVLNSTASVSVLLEIADNRSADSGNTKLALIVFSVVGDELYTGDTVKGEDDILYGLSDEGLAKYFSAERQRTVNKK